MPDAWSLNVDKAKMTEDGNVRLQGADRYYDKIKGMIGYYPSSYMKYCWRFLTPAACVGILLFSVVKFTPLKYNNTYQYPWWGYAIGLFLAFSSVLLTPLWILYSMAVTPGTVRQRLKTLCTPAADLRNASPKKTLVPETPHSDTELHALTEKPKDGCSEGESPEIRDISD